MANSPLGLNTKNPVTSSRIMYTHTYRGFPTWKRFQTKTQGSASPAGRAAEPPRWGFPVPPSPGATRTSRQGRGRGGTSRKRIGLSLNHTKNKLGRGRGRVGGIAQGEETARNKNRGELCPRFSRTLGKTAAEAQAVAAGRGAACPGLPTPRMPQACSAPPGGRAASGPPSAAGGWGTAGAEGSL